MKVVLYWFVLLGFVLLGYFVEGGHPSTVVQPGAILIVLFPVIGYLLITFGARGSVSVVCRLLKNELNDTDVDILDRAGAMGLLLGGVGAMLGMVRVMLNLSNPDALGAGVAVMLVSIFYGAMPALLFLPCGVKPKKGPVSSLARTKSAGAVMVSMFFVVLLSFFIIVYALNVYGK